MKKQKIPLKRITKNANAIKIYMYIKICYSYTCNRNDFDDNFTIKSLDKREEDGET